jgi:hypothetical protein
MTGDTADFTIRIKALLPSRWFGDTTPILDAVLSGLAVGWSSIFSLLVYVRSQSRLATAGGDFLDLISRDFFGRRLPRRSSEPDGDFRARISYSLQCEHATRNALSAALTELTGVVPTIFEPARPADTGAYAGPGLAYGAAGGWGNLSLPFQVFVTAQRPPPLGISTIAGYGTPGPLARASSSQSGSAVSDTDIYAAITSVLPTASTAWTSITN